MTLPLVAYAGTADDVIRIEAGDSLFLQSTRNDAAVVHLVYSGEAASLAFDVDAPAWGNTYTMTLRDPRPAGVLTDGKLRAMRESRRAALRLAAERERIAEARRHAAIARYWRNYAWR